MRVLPTGIVYTLTTAPLLGCMINKEVVHVMLKLGLCHSLHIT